VKQHCALTLTFIALFGLSGRDGYSPPATASLIGAACGSPATEAAQPSKESFYPTQLPLLSKDQTYAEFDAAKKELTEAREALARATETYQPTSSKMKDFQLRVALAEGRLGAVKPQEAEYQFRDAVTECKQLDEQLAIEEQEYNVLIKDFLPTSPQGRAKLDKIERIKQQRGAFPILVRFEARHGKLNQGDGRSWLSLAEFAAGDVTDQNPELRQLDPADVYAKADAMQHLAVVQAKAGDLDAAYNTITAIPTGKASPDDALNEIALWQAKCRNWEAATRTIAKMENRYGNAATANSEIAALCFRRGDRALAARYFSEATKSMSPSETGHAIGATAIATAFYSLGNTDEARAAARSAVAANSSVREDLNSDLAIAQAQAHDIDGALETPKSLLSDDKAYIAIAAELVRRGDRDGANRISAKFAYDPSEEIHALQEIVAAQMSAAHPTDAAKTLKELSELVPKSGNTANLERDEGANFLDTDDASVAARRHRTENADVFNGLSRYAYALAWTGDAPDAIRTVNSLSGGDYRLPWWKAEAIVKIAKIQIDKHDLVGALGTLSDAGTREDLGNAREKVCSMQLEIADVDGAVATFRAAGVRFHPQTVGALATSCASRGKFSFLRELFEVEPFWTALGAADGLVDGAPPDAPKP
jgi:hypothetical protein